MPVQENNRELNLDRTYNAPRSKVWEAWTDPKRIAKWWGPRGVTNPVCEFEAKPGGAIHIVMLAGSELGEFAGALWPMRGTVKQVEKPSRLVFSSAALRDDDEHVILENMVTVTFDEVDGQTNVRVHVEVTKVTPEAEGPLSGMKMGWTQQLDKLGEYLMKA
jgi:uncharacterized protein YndB with AHSA1/START domain